MTDFVQPAVGMGATVSVGTDRYAYTVIAVSENAAAITIQVQGDSTTPDAGHDYYGAQKWKHEPNPKGDVLFFKFEKNKANGWRQIVLNRATLRYNFVAHNVYGLNVGERYAYNDPHK